MINQCYLAIFYSEFPIKTLTQINLIYKQLFDRRQKQKLQKIGYKHYKTCQFTYILYLPMQQIRLAEPLVPRACITGMSPVLLSNYRILGSTAEEFNEKPMFIYRNNPVVLFP